MPYIWPIMMPALEKPAKLLDSKSLTSSFSCKQNLAGFFSLSAAFRRSGTH
jgi:hypothetical protein